MGKKFRPVIVEIGGRRTRYTSHDEAAEAIGFAKSTVYKHLCEDNPITMKDGRVATLYWADEAPVCQASRTDEAERRMNNLKAGRRCSGCRSFKCGTCAMRMARNPQALASTWTTARFNVCGEWEARI